MKSISSERFPKKYSAWRFAGLVTSVMLGLALLVVSACSPERQDSGYWSMHTIDDEFEGADGVDAADIDADGDLDLLVGWEESGRAMLYENPGPHRVMEDWRRTDVSAGFDVTKIEDARFADFDGDEQVDAIVSATENRNEKVNIHWLVDRSSSFSSGAWKSTSIDPSIQQAFMKVAIVQVDGAGAMDIVVGSKADRKTDEGPAQLLWYRAPENPVYANADLWKGEVIADIYWINTIEYMDIDQDGDNDVLMSDWNVLAWYENPGEASGAIGWKRNVISEEADSIFTNCALDRDDPSQIHLIVSAVSAQEETDVGDTLFYSIRKEFDKNGDWSGKWIESKLSSRDPLPSEIEENDYDLKGVVCGNIDEDESVDLVVSASGYGNGVFALMNLDRELGDQSLALKVISSDGNNTRKGIKHDNLLLDDLDGDGDLDVITTEENGNTGSYFFGRGLGLIWFENPG